MTGRPMACQAGARRCLIARWQGLQARFRGSGAQIDLGQEGQQIQVSVRLEDLQLQASLSLADRPPFLLAVGPVEGAPCTPPTSRQDCP